MFGYLLVGGIVVMVVLPAVRIGAGLVWNHFKPRMRGHAGESKLDRHLRKFRGKSFARVKDAMIPSRNKTAQIDNLLITRYGIFVLEMKNYGGVVKGRERTSNWIQYFPGSKKKPREFFNPIWQNDGHIRALKQLLGRSYPTLKYHNIVVFSDNCTIPQIDGVVTVGKLNKSIKDLMAGEPSLTNDDVAAIKDILEKNNIKGSEERAKHIAHAQYTATMAKQHERMEAVRKRAEEHREDAARVQNAYWTGRAALDGRNSLFETSGDKKSSLDAQIQSASCLGANNAPSRMPERTPEAER